MALLSNARDNGFVGVNMYVDDEGSIKGLPRNLRATEIAHCCGRPIEVRRGPGPTRWACWRARRALGAAGCTVNRLPRQRSLRLGPTGCPRSAPPAGAG